MSDLFGPQFSLVDSADLKLAVSFSGGRTSGDMCELIQRLYPLAQKVFVYMNTGEEAEPTLVFVDRCDKFFGLNVVWLEAVVHEGELKGSTHRIVDFATASRKGEPYDAVCKKYGVPNVSRLHCTREMKTNPFNSYIESIGWERGTYWVALGMRADEPLRISESARELMIWYPLKEAGSDKSDVNANWAERPFNLELEEEEGNCKTCFKKSDRKQIKNIRRHREWFDFPARIGQLYGHISADPGQRHVMFREHRTAEDMLRMADAFGDWRLPPERPNESGGCAESCEPDLFGAASRDVGSLLNFGGSKA